MGNKKSATPPKVKTQPSQVLTSGVTPQIEASVASSDFDIIHIKLVQLNLDILSKLQLHANVLITRVDDNYYCYFYDDLLGKVPGNYNGRLKASIKYVATIVEISQQPPLVTVEITV